MSKGIKILLTVLTILAGLGLGYLLLLAACGIACNGMEGLAYLVWNWRRNSPDCTGGPGNKKHLESEA